MGVLEQLDTQAAQGRVALIYVRIVDFDGSAIFYAGRVLDERIHHVEKSTLLLKGQTLLDIIIYDYWGEHCRYPSGG